MTRTGAVVLLACMICDVLSAAQVHCHFQQISFNTHNSVFHTNSDMQLP